MPARLTLETGTASPQSCELTSDRSFCLGRNRHSAIVLRDEHASRQHAELFYREDSWHLRDCGATNGTRLNGQRIRDTVALEHGDLITIGDIRLRFSDANDATPPAGYKLNEEPIEEPVIAGDQNSTRLKVDELSALVQFLNDSLRETSPRGLLKLALSVVRSQTGATLCGFLNLDSDNPLPRVVVPADGSVDAQLSKHLTGQTLKTNASVWLARERTRDFESDSLAAFSDAICIPLRAPAPGSRPQDVSARTPLGALHVYKTNHPFTEHQFRFCEVLGGSLASTLRALRSRRALEADNSRLRFRAPNQDDQLIGASPAMQQLRNQITRLADRPCTVLIVGESGVGKELVALGLHRQSSRCDGPLVPVNCAAIVSSMPESELFGHEMGSFTGATRARPGHFQLADEGTLFLDEIGELSLDCQARLLRVLETRSFCPVGADTPVTVDVRIIAATNRDLEKEVREGRFRGDLYYRLGMSIKVPPLRDHLEDVEDLVEHFLKKLNEIYRRQVGLTPAAVERLAAHSWPGNVRQLRTVLETTVAMAEEDLVQANDLHLARETPPVDRPPSLNLEELQLWAMHEAMKQTGGNKAAAARLLGVHRETLINKLKHSGEEP
jgi:two-component system, NtrC family, response regulator HydG